MFKYSVPIKSQWDRLLITQSLTGIFCRRPVVNKYIYQVAYWNNVNITCLSSLFHQQGSTHVYTRTCEPIKTWVSWFKLRHIEACISINASVSRGDVTCCIISSLAVYVDARELGPRRVIDCRPMSLSCYQSVVSLHDGQQSLTAIFLKRMF